MTLSFLSALPGWAIRATRAVAVASLLALSTACTDDAIGSVGPSRPDQVLARIRVTPRAATMAVGDALPVTMIAEAIDRSVFAGVPELRFTSADSGKVTVAADGTLLALSVAASPVVVEVVATAGGVSKYDSVLVTVTPSRAAVGSLSLALPPWESPHLGIGSLKFLSPTVLDTAGNQLFDVFVRLEVRDRASGVFLLPTLTAFVPQRRGTTWIIGSTTAYGQTFVDSVEFEFTDPTEMSVFLYTDPISNTILASPEAPFYLGAGGIVSISNYTSSTLQVRWSDSTAAEAASEWELAGNLAIAPYGAERRRFSTPGTYRWTTVTMPAQSGEFVVR